MSKEKLLILGSTTALALLIGAYFFLVGQVDTYFKNYPLDNYSVSILPLSINLNQRISGGGVRVTNIWSGGMVMHDCIQEICTPQTLTLLPTFDLNQ